MIKSLLIFCYIFFLPCNCFDVIQLDGIDYEIVPAMIDENKTSSLEELYYCDFCVCDDCLKERH